MRTGLQGADVRSIPRAAWICGLIACLNAACWSLITPPFQVPDEPSHFAYVQHLAETGQRPSVTGFSFSPEEQTTLQALRQELVQYSPQNHPIFTKAAQQQLEQTLAHPLPGTSPDAGFATSEPPLYYALETIPYFAGSPGTLLDRLALMRLLSALYTGVTALFVFMFLREALPRERWAWTVGGVGVAFSPLLALVGGAVNPDSLLCAVAAMLFYCLARGFRRGLTPRLAACLGAVIAAGLVTKLNFIGLVPGALLGLLLLSARLRRRSLRDAYRCLGLSLAIAASPFCVYVADNLLAGRAADLPVSGGVSSIIGNGSLLKASSYVWQFYLPRLPGMHNYFPGVFTTRQLWIDGFVGLYGWTDTVFPAWVDSAALAPLALLAVLLLRALLKARRRLFDRRAELISYAAIAGGLLILIGASDFVSYPRETGTFAQPRYLLPLIALYGAGLALAARGAGRRWGPVAGAAIVVVLIAHDLASQLLEISRFYG
jgi:4-amino-4-deoxy-L-arabinose transferase-like glycosyltransferase